MRNALLQGALPIYARLLADSTGVNLVWGASRPFTDGQTIHMPDLPVDDDLAKALAYGLIVHESGHITETTFDDLPRDTPFLGHIADALEDVRMERRQIARYPGAHNRLALAVDALVKTGYLQPIGDDATPAQAMSSYLINRLRSDLLGQHALAGFADTAETICRKLLPPAAVTRLAVMSRQITNAKSTAEAAMLAREIVKMLRDEQEKAQQPPPPPPPQQQPQGDAQGQDDQAGAGNQQSDGDAQPAPDGQPGQQAGDTAGGDQSGQEKGESSSPAGDNTDSAADGQATQQQADNLANVLAGNDLPGQDDVGDAMVKALSKIASTNRNQAITLPQVEMKAPGPDDGREMLQNLACETRALKRKLANLLEARAQSHRMMARRGRRLVTSRLHRIMTGNPRIFEKRIDGIETNTAILFLLDRSRSMRDQLTLAVNAVLGLCGGLSDIHGLSTAAAMFPAYIGGDSNGVQVLSQFGETIRASAPRFSGVAVCGCTPMAEAMMWAGYQLVQQPEDRKVLMLATDGDPDNKESTRTMIRMLEQEGIEVMALGINTDPVLFSNRRRIDSIKEMPRAVFEMLQQQLLELAA